MPPVAFPHQLERDAPPPPPPRRRPGEQMILRGVAAALVLGLVGGLVMRPNLDDQPKAQQAASARKAEIPREPEGMEIIVAPPRQPVTPISPPLDTGVPAAAPQTRVSPAPQAVVLRPRPRERARPSFNCRFARTTSERMVCVDPSLAAADRRLARAYGEAIQAGVPERVLRRQQDIWLGARESAARYGPDDVARVYEARISELEGMSRY